MVSKMAKGKAGGRRRVEIKKIENEAKRFVTFSKRRAGLFKKADLLGTLTGSEVGIIVFSPSNRVFTFGCPDVESVLARFKNQNPHILTHMDKLVQDHRKKYMEGLHEKLHLLKQQVEEEKRYGQLLDQINLAESGEPNWWEDHVMNLNLEHLEAVKVAMKNLMTRVSNEMHCHLQGQKDPCFQNPFTYGSGVAPSAFLPSSGFNPPEPTLYVDGQSAFAGAGPKSLGDFGPALAAPRASGPWSSTMPLNLGSTFFQ